MTERLDKQHRYPWPVIELAVAWHQKNNLTYRGVSEKLLTHGVEVSHKTCFEWTQKFGDVVSRRLRRKVMKSGWSVDESYVKVNGEWKYMYAAVDKQGQIHNVVFRDRRNLASAKSFLKKTMEDMI